MFFHDELLLLSDTALSSQLKADGIVTNADFDVRKSKSRQLTGRGRFDHASQDGHGAADPRAQVATTNRERRDRRPERGPEWFSEDDP